MRAGKLRHRIKIFKREVIPDTGKLQPPTQLVQFCEVWASVEPLTGKEETKADQEVALVTHRVRIRYRRGVEPAMRVQLPDGRNLGIEVVKNIEERDREMELLCVEAK